MVEKKPEKNKIKYSKIWEKYKYNRNIAKK